MKFLRKILDNLEPKFQKGEKLQKFYPLYEMVDTFLYSENRQATKAPYIRDAIDLKRSLIIVALALFTCLIFGIYNVGFQTQSNAFSALILEEHFKIFIQGLKLVLPIYLTVFTVGGLCEVIFSIIRNEEVTEGFLVTGFLIPLTMPPTIPLWMVAMGTVFGVVIGKEIFGGTGYNIFNPALTARAFIFFAYPADISGDRVWTADAVSQATPLLKIANIANSTSIDEFTLEFSWISMFLGLIPGSIGETSTLAVLIGAFILIVTGIGSLRIMMSTIVGMVLTSLLLNYFAFWTESTNSMLYLPFYYHFVMGSFIFGTVFMATDPVSAAHTNRGKVYYGLLIGFLCVIIRSINPAYPEGMMLAILFANAFAPLIDYLVVKKHIKKRMARYAKQ